MRSLIKTFFFITIIAACGREAAKSKSETAAQQDQQPRELDASTKEKESDPEKTDKPTTETPGIPLDLKDIKIAIEQIASDRFRITNQSPASVWYNGYEPRHSLYGWQGRQTDNQEWKTGDGGWCGTGLEAQELKSTAAFEMTPFLYSEFGPDITIVRFVLGFSNEPGGTSIPVYSPEIPVTK